MTDRDRLINVIRDIFHTDFNGTDEDGYAQFADYILADGWIRLPCKVGDTLWLVPLNGTIESREVKSIDLEDLTCFLEFTNGHCYSDWKGEYDEHLFLTKEKAEARNQKK